MSLFLGYHLKLDIYVKTNFVRMFLNSIMLMLCLLLDSEINKRFVLYTFMSLCMGKINSTQFISILNLAVLEAGLLSFILFLLHIFTTYIFIYIYIKYVVGKLDGEFTTHEKT